MTNINSDIKTKKIQVHGVPPTWSDDEFESRVASWINVYHNTSQCMMNVTSALPHDFLEIVSAKTAEGYSIARNQRVSFEPLSYSCWMIKPKELQQIDITEIRVTEKAKYVAFLESEHARYQDLLRQQLIQAAEAKEQKRIDDARNKRMSEIDSEVLNTFSPLVIPG